MELSLQNRQQDLDDHEGELLKFLPYDIFPLDQQPQVLSPLSSSNHNQLNYSNCSYNHSYADHAPASCMDLSQGLAAFSLIGPSPQPPPQGFHIMPAANLVQFFFSLACVPFVLVLCTTTPVFLTSAFYFFLLVQLQLFGQADHPSFPVSLPNQCCFICGGWVVGTNQVRQYGTGAVLWPSYVPVMNPVQSQVNWTGLMLRCAFICFPCCFFHLLLITFLLMMDFFDIYGRLCTTTVG